MRGVTHVMGGLGITPHPEFKVLLSHPGTGPHVQQTARSLYEADLLAAYVTCFSYRPDSLEGRVLRRVLRLMSPRLAGQLPRRRITELPDDRVILNPAPELMRMIAFKAPAGRVVADLAWEITERWFDRIVAGKYVAGNDAVYGYDHAALATFRAAARLGTRCIYEMPAPYYKTVSKLVQSEFERFPELHTAYSVHALRQDPRRNARRDAELDLANLVVVNSTFSRDALVSAGVPADIIFTVPLGSPLPAPQIREAPGSPVIFLSAGQQSVGKGTHYLLEAWRRLKPGRDVELWLVGTVTLPYRLLEGLPGTVRVVPAVSQEALFDIYQQASVLVFPSIVDGFGMVITEAMAHSLPVITTSHTAGPDLITDGVNGFLVPIRDSDGLATTMQWCIDHRSALYEMGTQALHTAASWQWSDFRLAHAAGVRQFLETETVTGVMV